MIAGIVIRRVIIKMPLAILSRFVFTHHVKTTALIRSEKLMAAVSNDLLAIITSKKSIKGEEGAFQK